MQACDYSGSNSNGRRRDGFLTCTTRTDKAGRRSGSRASWSSRWWVTTSSALSAFTSSAYLRKRTHAFVSQSGLNRSEQRNATQRASRITGNLARSPTRCESIERLTGRGGGGSGPRARPRRPGRPWRRRRRSAGGREPRCTPRGGGRACPSAARPRRPRTAAAAAPAAGDYPRPWIYREERLAAGGRAASRSKSGAATREGRAAPAPTALAWKVVART